MAITLTTVIQYMGRSATIETVSDYRREFIVTNLITDSGNRQCIAHARTYEDEAIDFHRKKLLSIKFVLESLLPSGSSWITGETTEDTQP